MHIQTSLYGIQISHLRDDPCGTVAALATEVGIVPLTIDLGNMMASIMWNTDQMNTKPSAL
jgi:hypothetical protein